MPVRHLLYLTLISVVMCDPLWSRDPEALDKSREYKQVIESARDALAGKGEDEGQRLKLQAALRGLQQFSQRYPAFQPDSITARLDACRVRLKTLTPPVQPPPVTPHKPSVLELYNQMEQLLQENIALRDALQAEKQQKATNPPEMAVDFQEALKTVADLQKTLQAENAANQKRLEAHAKEVAYLNDELTKLATINLELTGESERRGKTIDQLQAALKTASGKTFTREDELQALKKANIRLEATVTKLKAENDQAHLVIEGLKVENTEPLKKVYAETRTALLKQATQLGVERETAKQATQKMAEAQKALDVLQLQNAKLRETVKLYRQGSDNMIIHELENTVAVFKEKLLAATQANAVTEKQLKEWKVINAELLKSLKTPSVSPDAATQNDLRKQVETQRLLVDELRIALRERVAEAEELKTQLAARPISAAATTQTVKPDAAALTDEQKQEVQLLLQQAKAAVLTDNLTAAREFVDKIFSLDAANSTAKIYSAEVYLKQGNYADAQLSIADVEPGSALLTVLEAIHKKTGNTDYFLAQLFKAVVAQPENPEIRLITATSLRRIKYYQMAEYQLNELLKLTPQSFDCAREFYFLYVSMGLEYTNLQKKWYNKALEIDSKRRNELIYNE